MARLTPEHRRRQILDAALKVAQRDGLYHMNKSSVAREAKCSQPLVTHYFTSDQQLRKALLIDAVDNWTRDRTDESAATILSQAIVMRDPIVDCLSNASRSEILIDIAQNST